jgi:hypothetical protein
MIDEKSLLFADPEIRDIAERGKFLQKLGRRAAKRQKMSAEQIGFNGRRQILHFGFHRNNFNRTINRDNRIGRDRIGRKIIPVCLAVPVDCSAFRTFRRKLINL